MKLCRRCREIKPATAFQKHKRNRDGLQWWCRDCKGKEGLKWAREHKEQKKEYDRKKRLESIVPLVYVIKGVELFKIGHTNNFATRWKHYRVHMETEPQLIHLIQTLERQKVEKQLHTLYKDKRIRGEWFKLTDADVAYIRTIT